MDPDLVGLASFCLIRIRIPIQGLAGPELDPVPYIFLQNEKPNSTFSKIFQETVQNIKNYHTYNADETDKTMKTGTVVNKNYKKNKKYRFGTIF